MTTEMPGSEAELLAAARKGMSLPRYRAWIREQAAPQPLPDRAAPTTDVIMSGAFRLEDIHGRLPAPPIEIRIVLPFEILCPDNDKFGVIRGMMINTKRYRRAKKAIRNAAREQYLGPILEVPVALVGRVWFPGDTGDAPNFGKAVHDALEQVIYPNDRLLHDARWIRAGVDPDRPRAELMITAHAQPHTP